MSFLRESGLGLTTILGKESQRFVVLARRPLAACWMVWNIASIPRGNNAVRAAGRIAKGGGDAGGPRHAQWGR